MESLEEPKEAKKSARGRAESKEVVVALCNLLNTSNEVGSERRRSCRRCLKDMTSLRDLDLQA
jgi:hypothetical protein